MKALMLPLLLCLAVCVPSGAAAQEAAKDALLDAGVIALQNVAAGVPATQQEVKDAMVPAGVAVLSGVPIGLPQQEVKDTIVPAGVAALQDVASGVPVDLAQLQAADRIDVPIVRNLPLLLMDRIRGGLASNDGQYLAQDQAELQTYYDLAMTYRYFSDPILRQQLRLPKNQGIMIETVKPEGEGKKNGLHDGDIVLTVDDVEVDTQYDLVIALAQNRGEQRVAKIKRAGEILDLTLNLTELPDEPAKPKTRMIIGIHASSADEAMQAQLQRAGLVVTGLVASGPAEKAGIQTHDVVVSVNGKEVASLDALRKALVGTKGKSIPVDYYRHAKIHSVVLVPQAHQDHPAGIDAVAYLPTLDLSVQPKLSASGQFELTPQLAIGQSLQLPPASLKVDNSTGTDLNSVMKKLKSVEKQLEELKALLKK